MPWWFFQEEKVINVASQTYNLAGPYATRPEYLKSTVIRAVLQNSPSVGRSVVDGQIEGPWFSLKRFYRWAEDHFPEGKISGQISNKILLNAGQIVSAQNLVSAGVGQSVQIDIAFIDKAEGFFFAERYILDEHPELYETEWVADWDAPNNRLKIIYENTDIEYVTLPDYVQGDDYLYVYYSILNDENATAWVAGDLVTDLSTAPDLSAADPVWVRESFDETLVTVTLTETVETEDRTTDPATITSEDTDVDEDVTDSVEVLARSIFNGAVDGVVSRTEERLTIWKKHRVVSDVSSEDFLEYPPPEDPPLDPAPPPTVDETVTTTTESIEVYYETQVETRTVTQLETAEKKMFIYKMGSGNATLDAMRVAGSSYSDFFPIIPLRYYNQPIDNGNFGAQYDQFKKAYRRSMSQNIDGILDEIAANPSIADIDHAFMVFGVEANIQSREGKRYIYEFLATLMDQQVSDETDIAAFASATSYTDWIALHNNWLYNGGAAAGTPPPTYQSYPIPNISTIGISSVNPSIDFPYDVVISWMAIAESTHVGVKTTENDFLWEVMPSVPDPSFIDSASAGFQDGYLPPGVGSFRTSPNNIPHVRLYWQVNATSYKQLDIYGMQHTNYIYQGKSVGSSLGAAISQGSEVSGFVFPLHLGTMEKLPVVWRNELTAQNKLIVFNSYVVDIVTWWERGVFQILFAILLIVIVPVAIGGGAGLLGANATIGASLGFTGTAALVAGAAANAIAAIALTTALTSVANSLFGEKWGAVIAAVVSFLVGNMAANFQNTGNFALNWGQLMRADNLLKFTEVIQKSAAGYAQAEIAEIQEQMMEDQKLFDEESKDILQRLLDLGYSGVLIDPLMFIQEDQPDESTSVALESRETFLRRTLLTGSDIAELTMSLISDFPNLSTSLPDPTK